MGNRVIYTPAYDAEVEYLEGDGYSYIDTGIIATNKTKIDSGFFLEQWLSYVYIVGARPSTYKVNEFSVTPYVNGRFTFIYGNAEGTGNISKVTISTYYQCVTNGGFMSLYDEEGNLLQRVEAAGNTFSTQYSLYIYGLNVGGTALVSGKNSRIYYLKIWDNNVLVRDFIPVRIGNVGYMYDKVSKQLFGNKGTGQFILGSDVSNAVIPQQRCVLYFGSQRSVVFERIYEEYKWLKGDGTAYITHKDVDTLEVKVLELNDTGAYYEFGYLTNSTMIPKLYMGRGATTGSNYSGLLIYRGTSAVRANYRTPNLFISKGEHIITKTAETEQIGVFTDGVRHVKNSTTDSDYVGTNIIFNQLRPRQNLYIGYLSSPNIHNLIPVKLLQSIPAILDGNGIARQAGECGMWDKVNDKFYGNVSSGSFTVSND